MCINLIFQFPALLPGLLWVRLKKMCLWWIDGSGLLDNCDYNFVTFDDFGVKNDQKVSNNMILMSKYKGKHGGKKGQKIRAWVDPPPLHSGNARKKTFFLNRCLPLNIKLLFFCSPTWWCWWLLLTPDQGRHMWIKDIRRSIWVPLPTLPGHVAQQDSPVRPHSQPQLWEPHLPGEQCMIGEES